MRLYNVQCKATGALVALVHRPVTGTYRHSINTEQTNDECYYGINKSGLHHFPYMILDRQLKLLEPQFQYL